MNTNFNSSATIAPNQPSYTQFEGLNPDTAQAQRFLEALGFKSDGKLPIRTFAGKPQNKFPNARPQNLSKLPPQQTADCGVYIAVNGDFGAHKKADIKQARAIFCEHDDLSKEEQIYLWQQKGLPEPTIQVSTRNSIHNYWVFSEPITKDQFNELQPDLIAFAESDKACKDISRVMRVAGYYHVEYGSKPELCEIISDSGKAYSFDEMRSVIPKQQPELKAEKTKKEPQKTTKSRVDGFSTDSFLEAVTRKLDAEDIFSWEGHNFQYDASANKYRGCCPFHESKSGTSFVIDNNSPTWKWYCAGCEKGGTPLEYIHQINGYSGSPQGEDFKAIVEWLADKSGVEKPDMNKPTGKGVASASKLEQSKANLEDAINNIIELNLEHDKLAFKLSELSSKYGKPYWEIESLYKKRFEQLQKDDELQDRKQQLEFLLSQKNSDVDISNILPEGLAIPIKKMAGYLAVKPVVMATTLLCGVSALHHPEVKIWLNKAWNFSVTPNLFGSIVAEPSQKKTPILDNMLKKPLIEMNKKWKEEYQYKYAIYEEEIGKWEKAKGDDKGEKPVEPQERLAFINDNSPEGLAERLTKVPEQGIMWLRDELKGLFGDLNKYANGKGSQVEDILSFYDGNGKVSLRKGGTTSNCYDTLVSLFGTIQPEVLRQLMGNMDDNSGFWGRFLMVYQPLSASYMEDDRGGGIEIENLITSLYWGIHKNKSSEDYVLSRDAFELFRTAYNHYEKMRCSHNTKPALRALYGKCEGRAGKIAINIHTIKKAFLSEKDDHVIDAETMRAAIELNDFYIKQIISIYGDLDDDEETLTGLLAKIVAIADKRGEGKEIKVQDVNDSLNKREKRKSPEIMEAFKELEKLGYGRTIKTSRSLKFILEKQSRVESQTQSASQTTRDNSGTTRDNVARVKSPTNKGIEDNSGKNNNFSVSSTSNEQTSNGGISDKDKISSISSPEFPEFPELAQNSHEERDITRDSTVPSSVPSSENVPSYDPKKDDVVMNASQPVFFQADDVEKAKQHDNPYLKIWHLIQGYDYVAISDIARVLSLEPKEAKKHLDAIVEAGHREITDKGLYWDAF